MLVGGCPALGPVAAHGREAAVGDQAPQHDVSADVGALLKGRRRFFVSVGSYDANRHTTLLHAICNTRIGIFFAANLPGTRCVRR